ncbi:MAG: hypothetical protein AAGF47_05105 [Planctomycetota bacterium]
MTPDRAGGCAACPACGYDLAGLDAPRCPECGTAITPELILRSRTSPPGHTIAAVGVLLASLSLITTVVLLPLAVAGIWLGLSLLIEPWWYGSMSRARRRLLIAAAWLLALGIPGGWLVIGLTTP